MDIFQPAVEIHYSERVDAVYVATFDMSGLILDNPSTMKHEHLPTLLFQLADRGYQIEPEQKPPEGYKVIRCYSPAYMDTKTEDMARRFLAYGMKRVGKQDEA